MRYYRGLKFESYKEMMDYKAWVLRVELIDNDYETYKYITESNDYYQLECRIRSVNIVNNINARVRDVKAIAKDVWEELEK